MSSTARANPDRAGSPPKGNRAPSPTRVAASSSMPMFSSTNVDMSKVKLNSKGGVMMNPEDIQKAFSFLDADATGKISLSNLKKRLGVFFPEMTAKDYRFLMNNKKELTVQDLNDLIIDNEVTNFDPVAEAFKAYDPKGEGKLDVGKLKETFHLLGYGELSVDELDLLRKTADLDKDGIISLDDFRGMLEPEVLKQMAENK